MSACYTCAKYEADCTVHAIPICSICCRDYKLVTDQQKYEESQRQQQTQEQQFPELDLDLDSTLGSWTGYKDDHTF